MELLIRIKKLYNKKKLFIQIFIRFLCFEFLNIRRRFNITNIIPHSPSDSSLDPKPYSVEFASQ